MRVIKNQTNYRFFAVFDGHGGANEKNNHIVDYCVEHLPKRLFLKLTNTNDCILTIKQIETCFIDFDREIFDLFKAGKLNYGTTCSAVLIDDTNNKIYQINLGDSRSIVFTTAEGSIVSETKDHTPKSANEVKRIESAKGFVAYNRVLGSIAVSRAFGDFRFKYFPVDSSNYDPINACLSAVPDISVVEKTVTPMTIILTSDSPFSVSNVTNQSLVNDFVRISSIVKELHLKEDAAFLKQVLHFLVSLFIKETNDDTTLILVTV